ncbi:MAG: hypothetical protein WC546_00420 [Candidatus Omnitrophota bacterium]
MHCEICKGPEEDKNKLLTFSLTAYAQLASILKISTDKINKNNSSIAICIRCLQSA